MRVGYLALSILLVGCNAGAEAQQASTQPAPATTKSDCRGSPEEIRLCGEAWFQDCLKDWDSATHMSKNEYAKTCRRVAQNRIKALIEQMRSQDTSKHKSAGQ